MFFFKEFQSSFSATAQLPLAAMVVSHTETRRRGNWQN